MAKSKSTTPVKTTSSKSDFDEAKSARRIKDVEGARSIYDRMATDDTLRSQTAAQVRNQLEGGRPFDPAELLAQGAAWQTNVNFGDSRAACERTLLPYWKMINDVPYRAAFTIDSNSPQTAKWAVAFAECFDEFHEDWGADYFVQFMNLSSNYVKFGPGVAQWIDFDSPRYEAVNSSRIYWPKNTRMNSNSWEVMALVRDMSASELYSKIRGAGKRKNSEDAGWNAGAIEEAIVQMANDGGATDTRDFTRIADQLVNNDLAVTSPFAPIECVWLYVRQFDDDDGDSKIGCYCFTRQGDVNQFLFEDDDYAENFKELVGPIWYDTGVDSMVHSIKGFGIKNYYFSALQNRFKSRMIDAATIASGLNFQYSDDNHPDEAPPVENYGPVTVFPSGMTQLAIYPQLQQSLQVESMLANNAAENNSLYREAQQQIENTDTATQAKILANMQGQLSESSASMFLSQIASNIYTEQIRRLRKKGNTDEDAKEFVRRMRERGVPDEVLFKTKIRVKTGANAGMANPVLMGQKFQQLLGMSNIPGMNQEAARDGWLTYNLGANAVVKYTLPATGESQPAQRRLAQMENASFGQGMELPVAPEDAHFEHLLEHLKPLDGMEKQYAQSGELSKEQLSSMLVTIEHSAQHMQFLSMDDTMQQQMQMITPIFRSLQNTAKGILSRVQQQGQPQGAPVLPMTG